MVERGPAWYKDDGKLQFVSPLLVTPAILRKPLSGEDHDTCLQLGRPTDCGFYQSVPTLLGSIVLSVKRLDISKSPYTSIKKWVFLALWTETYDYTKER